MPRDLQAVLDAVLDGVLVIDSEGRIERLNSEASRILEVSSEKVAGGPIESLLGPDHLVASLARSVAGERRAAIADDVTIERRFGTDLSVDLAASPLIAEDGGGVVIVIRDHTVRDALQGFHARRAELSSYGQIAAGIAHEVKNPLGGIRGAAELIKGWTASIEGGRPARAADMIVREVDRISELIEDLMVFARGDQVASEETNLHRVLNGVIELVRVDPLCEGVAIERSYDPSIPELLADADRLTQVFLNLARNALQAMSPDGGTLTFSTGISLENRVSDERGRPVPTAIVSVRDSGPGIAADVLEKLPTPFFTTRKDGTGLGLAISQHWVDRHGGTLRIGSEVGVGTCVEVHLPLRGSRESAVRRGES